MPDSQKNLYKKLLGSLGEKRAEKFLKKKGYKIIDKNYVTKFGEIDLIGLYGDFIVFIEVKTRTNKSYGEAMEAVDVKKQDRYKRSARLFLTTHLDLVFQPRFDVIEVYPDEINHIEDAFR